MRDTGILVLMSIVFVAIFIVGVLPIIVGTILYHKTSHKRFGVALRIFGYIALGPSLGIGIILARFLLR